jgi:hypothetical protein
MNDETPSTVSAHGSAAFTPKVGSRLPLRHASVTPGAGSPPGLRRRADSAIDPRAMGADRVTATAIDAAGVRSAPLSARFTAVRRGGSSGR